MKLKRFSKKNFQFISDRLFIMVVTIALMFGSIAYQFYKIQIMEHDAYAEALRLTVQREVEIPAIRGLIYDRYGKPLVSNQATYVLKYDPQINLEAKEVDQTLLKVAGLLEANGDQYIDNVPITKVAPFTYTDDEKSVRSFIINYVPYNEKNKEEVCNLSAPELIAYLRGKEVLNIEEGLSDEEARIIIAMRLEIRQTTYQKYKKVTIAPRISMESLAAIEENQDDYPAVSVEVESQRYYTYGKAFGNILGYTRTITESQYEMLQDKGYEQDDIVGQVGIEGEMESQLRGEKGSKLIEVDNVGRTVFTLNTEEAEAGNDIYLTIDADLQVATYNALEKRLAEGIIQRLTGGDKTTPLTGREILVSMAKNNQIDLEVMRLAANKTEQKKLYKKLSVSYEAEMTRLSEVEKNLPEKQKTSLTLKQYFAQLLDSETIVITDQELLLVLGEQKSLNLSKMQMDDIRNGNYSLVALLISQLENGDLKPDQMDITPCSGTAIIVDPNTGQTLALVSYPSYDNNEFTQNFNNIYRKLHDGVDNRNIEINRALKTAKAPGSTFKMITGIAGLEEGVVTPETEIFDTGQFTKAGTPALRCWIYTNTGTGHGNENMEGALEVSCNYYFNEVVYRLGEKFGAPYGGIKVLTDYAEMFGLGVKSGIELEETTPNISNPMNSVTTQVARALNKIKNLKNKTEDQEALYKELTEYINIFYTLGNKNAIDLAGQVDYVSRPYIKKSVDSELSIVLNEDLRVIYEKLLEDYNEAFEKGVNDYAVTLATEVMSGDTSLSLKYRTKQELSKLLEEMVQTGTRKTILKSIEKIPDGVLENIFLQGYTEALEVCEKEEGKKQVVIELKNRIQGIEKGEFDYKAVLVDKILERIIDVYLDTHFELIEMEWTTRLNISSAIGQGEHTFTPVQMARYIAGLANGQTVYNLTILNGTFDHKQTNVYVPHDASVFNTLHFNEKTIETIRNGMRDVAAGSAGTARKYYADFPIEIAAKTGTAQEGKYENSWVVTFAPYNNPEIAVVASMYGTDGLGSYSYELMKDIYTLYFKLNKQTAKISLDNQFVE